MEHVQYVRLVTDVVKLIKRLVFSHAPRVKSPPKAILTAFPVDRDSFTKGISAKLALRGTSALTKLSLLLVNQVTIPVMLMWNVSPVHRATFVLRRILSPKSVLMDSQVIWLQQSA